MISSFGNDLIIIVLVADVQRLIICLVQRLITLLFEDQEVRICWMRCHAFKVHGVVNFSLRSYYLIEGEVIMSLL